MTPTYSSSSSPAWPPLLQGASAHIYIPSLAYRRAKVQPSMSTAPPPIGTDVAVIIGVLTAILLILLLLLIYARHCKRSSATTNSTPGNRIGLGVGLAAPSSTNEKRCSGVDRSTIESLPVFAFRDLEGSKDGLLVLDCAVCLGRFEAEESIRLLPKCSHGFHVSCVDTWLEAHSTCPLCRARVEPGDALLLQRDCKPSMDDDRKAAGQMTMLPSCRHSTGSMIEIVIHRPDDVRARRSSSDCFESQRECQEDWLVMERRAMTTRRVDNVRGDKLDDVRINVGPSQSQ